MEWVGRKVYERGFWKGSEERQVELPDERYAPEGELERSEARRAVG